MKGLPCPACGSVEHGVRDSRLSIGTIRRRRVCEGCAHAFTTYEYAVEPGVVSKAVALSEELAGLLAPLATGEAL